MKKNKPKTLSVGLIPVRLNSSRLFKKALLEIDKMPMVVHTYKRAVLSKSLEKVFICTDSNEISRVAKRFRCNVIKTGAANTGTDRISEAAEKLKKNYDLYVDIQGDEPLINPKHIDKVVEWHSKNMDYDIVVPSLSLRDANNPNIVKIVESKNKVLYFSRAAVPYPYNKKNNYFSKHLSVISFKPKSLKQFRKLPRGKIEKIEGIELMRALENNMKIGTFRLNGSSFSVDTNDDFIKVLKFMNIDKIRKKY